MLFIWIQYFLNLLQSNILYPTHNQNQLRISQFINFITKINSRNLNERIQAIDSVIDSITQNVDIKLIFQKQTFLSSFPISVINCQGFMPFYIINQPEEKLKQYLNRRESTKSPNQTESVNDFFLRSKYDSQKRLKKSKRFNTSLGEHCDVDFRIQTRYKPSIDYKFTGENFKTKYWQQKQRNSLNTTAKEKQKNSLTQGLDQKTHIGFQLILNRLKRKTEPEKKIDLSMDEEFNLTKSFLIPPQNELQLKSRCKSLKQEFKFKIRHPTPVKEAQFLVRMKKDFVKRHRSNKKEKKSIHRNDLIKIQDYLSQKKESFKRSMQTELIRIGQARLLSRFEERKGKIYLGGLHNAGKKKKSIENIDQLLRKSRGSFSSPNNLISHLKLTSEKKNRLQTISKLKQRTLQNCLQKIKSLNMKSEMISHSMKVND